jgi:hypothetical protein
MGAFMISRFVRRWESLAALALLVMPAGMALAVDPNPLENAYWRFEEGQAGNQVGPVDSDVVQDSANDNDLRAPVATSPPTYTNAVPPRPLRSGNANNLALDFTPNNDLITSLKNIENGIIAPGRGFTIEAAFRPGVVQFPGGAYHAIIAKEGEPANDTVDPKSTIEKLPTLVLKIRGDNGLLQFEQFDQAKTLVSVSSAASLEADQWYYAAAVNNGSSLQLYLDRNDGNGYQLQSTVAVSGALYQGPNSSSPSWSNTWLVGRGHFDGPADFFDGIIDEVRLSNTALSPEQFLFAPGIDGDYNDNKVVDAADYAMWRKNLNTSVLLANDPTPNVVDQSDYDLWRHNFGKTAASLGAAAAVPEPSATMLIALCAACSSALSRKR